MRDKIHNIPFKRDQGNWSGRFRGLSFSEGVTKQPVFSAPASPGRIDGLSVDQGIAAEYLASDDEARKQQAARDAVLAFPEAMQAFNIVLDIPISKDTTARLHANADFMIDLEAVKKEIGKLKKQIQKG